MKKYRGQKSRDTAPSSCKLLCLRRQPRQMNKHPPVVQTPQRKSINNYNQRRHNPEAERFVQSPTQLLNLNFKAHISQLGEIVLHKEWLRCEKKLRFAFSWHCTFKLEPWWKGRREEGVEKGISGEEGIYTRTYAVLLIMNDLFRVKIQLRIFKKKFL